ncbi:MAG TPA: hypothetical protein VEY95_01045 [Azospirillaceae bacterium]|nr:hypothetical protein [Azospirillaceae bacterium]
MAHDKPPLALDRITRAPNTMAAHRLVRVAASLNRFDVAVDPPLVDLLLEACFASSTARLPTSTDAPEQA